MELPIVADLAIIFVLSIVVLFLFHKLGIPGIVGFLLTGILAGPHGFGLISAVHEVEVLAEIGVILLLFTIGIEFSLANLLRIKRNVLIGGALQVCITIAVIYGIAVLLDVGASEALFFGFVVSLSSTAIVLKALQERSEMDTAHGRTALGILIFQDIAIVPMMLITPLLGEGQGFPFMELLLMLAKGLGVALVVVIAARYLVPQLLHHVARTRKRELFLLTIVSLCAVTAWLTSVAGLSLALGAFMAGLIISDSEYSHQAISNVIPFRDLFTSLFFVSVGMLLDARLFLEMPLLIPLTALGILALKFVIAGFASFLLGHPLQTVLSVGLILSQVGEFSFILARTGMESGMMSNESYQFFLAVSILTMIATPFIIMVSPRIVVAALTLPLPERIKAGIRSLPELPVGEGTPEDHIIIVGYGLNGRNVARTARAAGIPYTIIEMNPETVREERKRGESIFFGNATQPSVLEHATIQTARCVVVVISDPVDTRGIVATVRELNTNVRIIARTRLISEVPELFKLGANEVIPEEFETSIEIFTRVLRQYQVPAGDIQEFTTEVRADGYEMYRTANMLSEGANLRLDIPNISIESLNVTGTSPVIGQTIKELNLRKEHLVTILAIRREEATIANPDADSVLEPDDVVVVLGERRYIADVAALFAPNVEVLPKV